jgi:hypothetical protein
MLFGDVHRGETGILEKALQDDNRKSLANRLSGLKTPCIGQFWRDVAKSACLRQHQYTVVSESAFFGASPDRCWGGTWEGEAPAEPKVPALQASRRWKPPGLAVFAGEAGV